MHSYFYPLRRPLFFFLSFILSASISLGQSWQPGIKVVASDRISHGSFGHDISISGNYALIGALSDNGAADGKPALDWAGAAYLFFNDHGVWKQIKKIYPPVRAAYDYFGMSVCIKDDYMIIGSKSETDANEQNRLSGAGAAYIFAKNQGGADNWGFVKKVTSPNRKVNEYFGNSVAIDGNNAIAGVYYEPRGYVLEKNAGGTNNWGSVATLIPQTGNGSNSFGGKVAISGEYVVVGAYSDYNSGTGPEVQETGSAHIFKKTLGGANSWGLAKKIMAPPIAESASFGMSVSIDGDQVVVGAPRERVMEGSTLLYSVGAAYLFSKNNGGLDQWGLGKKLTADVRRDRSNFGCSVAIRGGTVVVGAQTEGFDYKNEDYVINAGAAWVFSENRGGIGNWGQTAKIHAPDRDKDDSFGNAVALNDTLILVGAIAENNGGPFAFYYPGAAYSFSRESALPVKLVSFSAEQREKQAHLKWTTTEETNSSHFEIQRSADGRTWTTLENVKAANESRVAAHYDALDKSPLAGQNLYRLKMVDNDGTFAYSKIQTLTFNGPGSASFYPNPVSERLVLAETTLRNTVSLKLLDQTGKPVFETSKPVPVIHTGHLSNGTYILQITRKDGTMTSSPVAVGN